MVKKSSFKQFIGHGDIVILDIVIMMTSLCIKLPQMIAYAKYFDSNKTMSFKVFDKKSVKKV